MRYKYLLFDLDGTLLDFKAAQRQAFFACCDAFSVHADDNMLCRYDTLNESLWRRLEKGEITREQLFLERFKIFFKDENISGISPADFQKRYMTELSKGNRLMKGARELLERLQGRFSLNVITNGVSMTQRKRLHDSGIYGFFDNIVISEELGIEKPDSRYFEKALEICGITDRVQALVIGDSLPADVAGALNSKINVCWLNAEGKACPESLTPTYIISELDELDKILTL